MSIYFYRLSWIFCCFLGVQRYNIIKVSKLKYEIGTRIRKFREDRGLNQKEFGDMIGVSNSRISNWEQGINRPDADILADICVALNVSPSELLDVRLSSDELNDKERKIIMSYRAKTDLQKAVDILLGVEEWPLYLLIFRL